MDLSKLFYYLIILNLFKFVVCATLNFILLVKLIVNLYFVQVINTKVAIMSKESISYTFNTGVTTSNRQINKKYKNKQKKNLKNQLSGVKKNKLVEDILKDWENDDCFYSENSDLNISGILPITNEVVTKNKLLDVEKDKLIEELLKDWD